jgi:8-hydroxy-5-deazaflavin:NADPH oxidoreductase
MVNVGFIGGTGVEGRGLALRLAAAGVPVAIGSRSEARAAAAAAEYNSALGQPLIRGVSNREAVVFAEIVFLTVKFEQTTAAIESCRDALVPGKLLVDVTIPVRFEHGHPVYAEPAGGSAAEFLAERLPPGVPLVASFKTMPAKLLADLHSELQCDEFVCGDSQEARGRVIDLVRLIPTLRPVDAGALKMARVIERMTVLAIQLNRSHKRDGARFTVVGI